MSNLIKLLDDGRFVIVTPEEFLKKKNAGSGWLIDTSKSKNGRIEGGECIASFGMANGIWCAVKLDAGGRSIEVIAKGDEKNECIVALWHWKRENFMRIPAAPWKSGPVSRPGPETDPA